MSQFRMLIPRNLVLRRGFLLRIRLNRRSPAHSMAGQPVLSREVVLSYGQRDQRGPELLVIYSRTATAALRLPLKAFNQQVTLKRHK